jgi:FkbH-like protein
MGIEPKYSEILRQNTALARNLGDERYKIAVLANVTVSQIKEILEYTLRVERVPAVVTMGDYDNIVQDSLKYKQSELVLLFWEPYSITGDLQYRIDLLTDSEVNEIFDKTCAELGFVFKNLQDASLVLMNTFTALPFSAADIVPAKLEELTRKLNGHLRDHTPKNVRVIDLDKVVAQVGIEKSFDLRYWYSAKAPYTIDFLKAYSLCVKPFVLSSRGKAKKALIFDCDNTLWKGVLGEEGASGIQMSRATKEGNFFADVQSIALSLNKQGVLIGLCSKNNPQDVDEVVQLHPDMQLRDENLAVKRVNWADKVSNLREIARELNIGLDSLVFVEDSAFELNLVRSQLPEVTVLQVPESLHLYPSMLRANGGLFYSLSVTAEDAKKTEMYKDQANRQVSKLEFGDLESYLASLGTKLTIHEDDVSIVIRMAQLSQKTNQFNLTTIRYTEGDIGAFVSGPLTSVLAFSVSDRFGDSGITGLCIVKNLDVQEAVIDTFLMSCRVLGRNVEYAFMNWLIERLERQGVRQVYARYVVTAKNAQVKEFFDRCSFSLTASTEKARDYVLNVGEYKSKQVEYVEIIDGSRRSYQECHGGRL